MRNKYKCYLCLECGRIYTHKDVMYEKTASGLGFLCDCGSDWFAEYHSLDGRIPPIKEKGSE